MGSEMCIRDSSSFCFCCKATSELIALVLGLAGGNKGVVGPPVVAKNSSININGVKGFKLLQYFIILFFRQFIQNSSSSSSELLSMKVMSPCETLSKDYF